MFKSSENLRLAAEMRALQRVAAPWREARATWFDGSPDSIAARIAATDRVLAHARSGFTAAHLALTAEAETARRELLAAKHRLLTDFLDDGARAFKGSKRVADMYVGDLPRDRASELEGHMSEILKRIHPTKARLLQQDLNELRDHIADQDDFGAEMLDDNPGDYDHNGPILGDGIYRNHRAQASKGSKRVAGSGWDDHPDYPRKDWQYEVGNGNSQLGYPDWVEQQKHYNDQPNTYEDRGPGGLADIDDDPSHPRADWQYEVGNNDTWQGYHDWVKGRQQDEGDEDWGHLASLRTADETTGFGDLGPGYEHFGDDDFAEYDDYLRRHDYHTDHRALEHRLSPGFDDDDPARYSALRPAAIEFVAAQNTTDRGELMYRAHRHASDLTGRLPVAQAREAVKAFVAAVRAEAPRVRQPRTAAAPTTLPDFDDQLLFDS